jgi:hypothetical protein
MDTTLEIAKFKPCEDALAYRATHSTFAEAWQHCPRGDWMLWIATKAGVDKRTLTLAKALCAKTVIHLMRDERSRKAVEVAEAYGCGKATDEELSAAAAAAADAAHAAHAAARKKNRQATADICREILTDAVLKLMDA